MNTHQRPYLTPLTTDEVTEASRTLHELRLNGAAFVRTGLRLPGSDEVTPVVALASIDRDPDDGDYIIEPVAIVVTPELFRLLVDPR